MRLRKGLGSLLLLALEKGVDGTIRLADFGFRTYRYKFGIPEVKQSALSKAIKRLRENGLIDFIDDEKLILRLTDRGREQALWAKIKYVDEKWDKRWRLVIFDIPEKRRAARDLLRMKLKEWGFTRWQKSVWATKKNCTNPLRDFLRQIGIEDWVMVIESDNIGR